MLSNTPQAPSESNYEAVISLMQAYDCSYEQAERHLQLLGNKSRKESDHTHVETSIGEENMHEGWNEDNQEGLELEGRLVRFTPKELKALGDFFSGRLSYFKNPRKKTFCQRTSQKLRSFCKKMKCLKSFNPKRIWRSFKRRQSASYKQITSLDLTHSTTQHAKGSGLRSGERWMEIDADWKDELDDISAELSLYLNAHRELVYEVKGLSGEGVKVSVPTTMQVNQNLRPLLFVRENVAENIAENVKLSAQKRFKIICLDNQQFFNLFSRRTDTQAVDIALAGYNIFQELQILSLYKTLTLEDVDRGQQMFRQFIIKNRLFKSIIERDVRDLSFAYQQQHSVSSEQDEEEEKRRREVQTHKSIIKQQDTLYQSMLSTYTARETERQEVDQSILQIQTKKQAIKQSIRQQPTPSHDTIHLTFRTPNGTVLSRHFHQSDSIQYVKNWITIQDQIQFEGANVSFDLYHGYPPSALQCGPSQTLESVFGKQEKVRIIIKEN